MNMIKLSICIPTYNREKFLREAIDSVIVQLTDDMKYIVEIVVSDNASIDNTEQLIKSYKSEFSNIVFYRWSKNMGADFNYLKVIELAHGEYCWFLGSDDKLIDGSIQKVMRAIEKGTEDILLFSRNESDVTLTDTPVLNSWSTLVGDFSFNSLKKEKFHYYLDSCNSLGGVFSYLSVIVFKKSKWDDVPDKERFVGSAYVHVHALFSILKTGANFCYIKEPVVLSRLGNDSFCDNPRDASDLYSRFKLDVDGYRDISLYIFGSDSYDYNCIYRLMQRNMGIETFARLKYMLKAKQGDKYDNSVELLLLHSGYYGMYFIISYANNRFIRKLWAKVNGLMTSFCKNNSFKKLNL